MVTHYLTNVLTASLANSTIEVLLNYISTAAYTEVTSLRYEYEMEP